MARTKGISAASQKEETIARRIEYRGYTIAKLSDGSLRVLYPKAVYPNEPFMPVESLTEGKSHIDKILSQFVSDSSAKSTHSSTSAESKSRVTDNPRKRSRRTKGAKMHKVEAEDDSPAISRGRRTKGVKSKPFDPEAYKHLSHGGYRQNPPADCSHKIHWEGEPDQLFWADNIICAGTCKKSEQCEHFKEFQKGSRRRIKLMTTERMGKECEWCKAPILETNEEGSGTYRCGTTYDRLEGQYTRVCKPPKKEKKQKETKPKKRRRTK